MLTIRLQRLGRSKFATYRLIISEKARDTQGRYLEQLGVYNPHAKENQFNAQVDRVKYWISKGASSVAGTKATKTKIL
jgi:small subunit ribosomal protein S16